MTPKLFPFSVQSFNKIRRGNYVYVDKTGYVHKMVSNPGFYFLSRPRRFGKSILLSTIASYYEADQEAFRDTELLRLAPEWQARPVLRLDFTSINPKENIGMTDVLQRTLDKWEEAYGVTKQYDTYSMRFLEVISAARQKSGQKVVILIDEYDKPMVMRLECGLPYEDVRQELKAFYSVLKTAEADIHFAMLTGVTRFPKVSVFSALNSLKDISLNPDFASICGFTERELHATFDEAMPEFAAKQQLTPPECYERLRRRYDGYCFAPGAEKVYNPFSIVKTFDDGYFSGHWFESGTPGFLAAAVRDTHIELQSFLKEPVLLSSLSDVDSFHRNPVPLMYQSGYLTLDTYDGLARQCTLRFPNEEVREGWMQLLAGKYLSNNADDVLPDLISPVSFYNAVRDGRPDVFMAKLKAVMDARPAILSTEATFERDFQNCMFCLFTVIGLWVTVEQAAGLGFCDMTVSTPNYVYLFEFKLCKSPRTALAQIDRKRYADAFACDTRKLFKIGVSFSPLLKSIIDYKIVERKNA